MEKYKNTPAFLTAYQLAVLVDEADDTLKGDLSVGGLGEGPNSLAAEIARRLSREIGDGYISKDGLVIQFLDTEGLEVLFGNRKNTNDENNEKDNQEEKKNIPSSSVFSMFRLLDEKEKQCQDLCSFSRGK